MNSLFDTDEEDKFAMGSRRIADASEYPSKPPIKDWEDEEEPPIKIEEPDYEKYGLDKEGRIDVESPMARFIRGRTEAARTKGEPTELQKQYEEMGLEYDYQKREETGKIRTTPEERFKQIEQINPDFAQRHTETDRVVNLRQQLIDNYEREIGRINAIEMQVWANPSFAASPEGRAAMQLIRRQQQTADALFEREDARLDKQYYEKLPPKDMSVANMVLSKGFKGKEVTYYTNNHGDIRDSVNDILLYLPDDRKDEFVNRVMGDYLRDEQGNIVRNELGEELRAGSDIIALSPAGTYDFRVTGDAYSQKLNEIFGEYAPKTLDIEKTKQQLDKDISRIDKAIAGTNDQNEIDLLEKQRSELARELVTLIGGGRGEQPTTMSTLDDASKQLVDIGAATVGIDNLLKPTPGQSEETIDKINKLNEMKSQPETKVDDKLVEEENKLDAEKSRLLQFPGVTELPTGVLVYSNDLTEEEKKVVEQYNRSREDLEINKSGRSPFLEGTGLATVGRGIGGLARGAYEYSEKAADFLPGVITPGKVSRAYEGISDFLSGFSESGRSRILEEQKAKTKGI